MIGRALIARRYRQQTHFVHLPHFGLMHLALSQKPRYHDVRVGHHNRVGPSNRCKPASPGNGGKRFRQVVRTGTPGRLI